MAQGLLTAFMQEMSKFGIHPKPSLTQNELTFEISAEELRNALLKGVDPRVANTIGVEIHEGRIVIKVRLI